jgi:hypothetical protein
MLGTVVVVDVVVVVAVVDVVAGAAVAVAVTVAVWEPADFGLPGFARCAVVVAVVVLAGEEAGVDATAVEPVELRELCEWLEPQPASTSAHRAPTAPTCFIALASHARPGPAEPALVQLDRQRLQLVDEPGLDVRRPARD